MNLEIPIRELEKNEFPPQLLEIPQPPEKLFIRGELPNKETKLLCVVGSRKYTPYGKEVCEKLIGGLRGYSICIVSGLALGIDAIAHRSAVDAGLKTIAVPGSGLNSKNLYPSSNLGLSEMIINSGGALLSEFEPNFRATTWSFPQRNRIMAGLSHAILIIEAEIKSGTLITSRLATEYNKDVLTIPGSIFSKNSEGPHMLLKLGATPITKSEDILEALGFNIDESKQKKLELEYNDCSDEERKIIKILETPMSRDEIINISEMPVTQINAILSIMEIKGLIKENFGEIHLN